MSRADRAGVALAGLLIGWTAATTLPRAPIAGALQLLILLGVVSAYLLGRLRGARCGVRVAAPLALAGLVLLVVIFWPRALSGAPAAPPLGYGNANGALLLLATGAAAMAASAAPDPELRRRCVVLVPIGILLCWRTGSAAATAACWLIIAALVCGTRRCGRLLLLACAALTAAASATVVVVGALPQAAAVGWLEQRLPNRPQLWAQAVDLVRSEPLAGHGPGAFAALAPIARDPDLRRPHSLVLQQAVETGVVGAALLVAVLVWAGVMLLRRADTDRYALLAGVLLCGLLTQAAIDYTASFPLLPLALAGLVGAGHSAAQADTVSGPSAGA